MRRCSQCHVEKPESDFAKDARRRSGLQAACRRCQYDRWKTPWLKRRRAAKTAAKRPVSQVAWSARALATPEAERHRYKMTAEDGWAAWRSWVEEQAPLAWLRARRAASGNKWPQEGTKLWYRVAGEREIEAYRARIRGKYAVRYARDPEGERERQRAYKHSRPEVVDLQRGRRAVRVARLADGTLTRDVVRGLLAAATRCPYCGASLGRGEKSLDHIVPVAHGGAHGLVNVVVCCRGCNVRKGARPFADWLAMLPAAHARRAARLYRDRFGTEPAQGVLALTMR